MVDMHYQSVEVQIGRFKEKAALLFSERQLLALMVYLDPLIYLNDPEIAGKWSLEIGFGACAVGSRTVLFEDLDAGLKWADAQMANGLPDWTK